MANGRGYGVRAEIHERRWRGGAEENVLQVALGQGGGVEGGRLQRCVVPTTRVQALEQHLDRGDGLGLGERAVAGPVDEGLPQQGACSGSADRVRVGAFVGRDDETIASRVHRQNGDVQPARRS